ncbi:MAG: hypothetical protein EPO07_03945 [Verrucomicrobia bacterium]|nr:MAG: hypothetical protein EPO07_03945 [Verrucomicrobiota bacterium]
MNRTKQSKIGFAFSTALLGVLTGCVGYADGRGHARIYAPAPTVYVDAGIVVQDDYVYYPGYQVYYSSNRRQYIYQDGSSWVTRTAPPHVSVDVLFASPSVSVDFHDAPAVHHATVVQTYPKNWTPPGWSHGNKGGNKGGSKEGHDEDHDQGNKHGKKGQD